MTGETVPELARRLAQLERQAAEMLVTRDQAAVEHRALRERMDLLSQECEQRIVELAAEVAERQRALRSVWVALIGVAGSLAVWVLTRLG